MAIASVAKSIVRNAMPGRRHWVGDGFHVTSMFDYGAGAVDRSPFLLFDYGAPSTFPPNTGKPRGVGPHPHRGFETVTIVFDGEVEHRDSTGGGGVIGKGDVQWMTAGSGILHAEYHSPQFSRRGGTFHVIQLWVNLPARHKWIPPAYQALTADMFPEVKSPGARTRVIAGTFGGKTGPARTHSPMAVLDCYLDAGATLDAPQPAGWTTLLMVVAGTASVNGAPAVAGYVELSHAGSAVTLAAGGDAAAHVVVLAGEPLGEPVVGHGPFVMNSREEIDRAWADFHAGRMGTM